MGMLVWIYVVMVGMVWTVQGGPLCQDGQMCNPVADPKAVIESSDGLARFTVLTDRLLRLEYRRKGGAWENGQTVAVWNRKLPVPAFHTSEGAKLVIETDGLVLTYENNATGAVGPTGAGFPQNSLQISLKSPVVAGDKVWTPASSTEGNLFGTVHDLDTMNGWQSLNCTSHGSTWTMHGEGSHCVWGLASTKGWAVVDDSHRPRFDGNGWFASRLSGECAASPDPLEARPCFEVASLGPSTAEECEAAGCCFAGDVGSTFHLYFSASRQDHFTSTNCAGCQGSGYVDMGPQVVMFTTPNTSLIPVYLFWNAAAADNAVSTVAPSQPGYKNVSKVAYIFPPGSPQPSGTTTLCLYYSADAKDHWTTASPAEEEKAKADGYKKVATLGYAPPPPPSPTPTPLPQCHTRTGSADLYFFGHGIDFSGALRDFAKVFGRAPLTRRAMLGTSWSIWDESLNTTGTMDNAKNLMAMGNIGLSSYILDMSWHRTPEWGSYSWDPVRYESHKALVGYLHSFNLSLGLNFHDDNGVASYEEQYVPFAEAMGVDPSTNVTIPFNIQNRTYADNLESIVVAPLMHTSSHDGVDMIWTDWQQGLVGSTSIGGLSPTMVLNHLRFHSFAGTIRRGLIHSRFGGLGGHRYPTFFGGDYAQNWESLSFMVYFNAVAANAMVGYWAQEVMQADGGNPELFSRLISFSAFSPVLTFWGNIHMDDKIWNLPEPFKSSIVTSLHSRAMTLPFRYTLARELYDNGLAPVRPLYYSYPLHYPEAYSTPYQYMFGRDMLVVPVTQPAPPGANYESTAIVTVPPEPSRGWFDFYTGSPVFGSVPMWSNVSLQVPLDTIPVFVRGGTLIPLLLNDSAGAIGSITAPFSTLELRIFPPNSTTIAHQAPFSLYEDDGISNEYAHGAYTNTTFTLSFTSTSITIATVGVQGPQTPTNVAIARSYTPRFLHTLKKPASILLNSKPLIYNSTTATSPLPGQWAYDATTSTAIAQTPPLTVKSSWNLQLRQPQIFTE